MARAEDNPCLDGHPNPRPAGAGFRAFGSGPVPLRVCGHLESSGAGETAAQSFLANKQGFASHVERWANGPSGIRLHPGLPGGGRGRAGHPAPHPHRPRPQGRPHLHRPRLGPEYAPAGLEYAQGDPPARRRGRGPAAGPVRGTSRRGSGPSRSCTPRLMRAVQRARLCAITKRILPA